MSGLEASRQFWDEKARENPYWYVSPAGPHEGRNLAEFWASGPKIWNDLKSASGYVPRPTDTGARLADGARRLYRNEWYGIRPTIQEIESLSPIKTKHALLHGDKWLFFGMR
jgi:hypothetical protein